jgi:hypothetical protein
MTFFKDPYIFLRKISTIVLPYGPHASTVLYLVDKKKSTLHQGQIDFEKGQSTFFHGAYIYCTLGTFFTLDFHGVFYHATVFTYKL